MAGLAVALYWHSLAELSRVWHADPNYSHGFVVPLLSVAFAAGVVRRNGLGIPMHVDKSHVLIGVLEMLIGVGLHVVAWFLGNLLLDVLGLVCLIRGTILCTAGPEANRVLAFPVLFLLFMAPLPVAWYQRIAVALQQIAASMSAWILDVTGVPTFRQGVTIQLPGFALEVGQACSGLRQLTAVLALAAAVGYLLRRGNWLTISLMLLAVPIAVVANAMRIVLTGWTLVLLGQKWAEGVYHFIEGVALLATAGVLILAAAGVMIRIEKSRRCAACPQSSHSATIT